MAIRMTDGQAPDDHFFRVTSLRRQVDVSSARLIEHITVQGMTKGYSEVNVMTYRYSKIGLE